MSGADDAACSSALCLMSYGVWLRPCPLLTFLIENEHQRFVLLIFRTAFGLSVVELCYGGLPRAFVGVLTRIGASVKSPFNNFKGSFGEGGEFIVILEGGAVRVVGCFTT